MNLCTTQGKYGVSVESKWFFGTGKVGGSPAMLFLRVASLVASAGKIFSDSFDPTQVLLIPKTHAHHCSALSKWVCRSHRDSWMRCGMSIELTLCPTAYRDHHLCSGPIYVARCDLQCAGCGSSVCRWSTARASHLHCNDHAN